MLLWEGIEGDLRIMVTEMLGPNLADLFKACGNRFSNKSVSLLAVQLFDIIKGIHSRGVAHRCIQPEHLCMGNGDNKHLLYFVNYSYCKRIKLKPSDVKDLDVSKVSYPGHIDFVSPYVMAGESLGSSRDDLFSIFYCLRYFTTGSLPWITSPAVVKRDPKVVIWMKDKTSLDEMCREMFESFHVIYDYAFKAFPDEKIDFTVLKTIVQTGLNNHNYQDFKFDWFKIRDVEYLKHQAEVEARKIRNEHVIKGQTFDKAAYLTLHPHFVGLNQASWI